MPINGKNKPQAEAANSAILTKQQAAGLLQSTVRYVERMIKAGRLRACKPSGKFVRIFRKDLDAFLDKSASMRV
jgi:excisionase family DNA binding protein